MKLSRGGLLAAAACVALAGCHFGGGTAAPTGQVVAKVGDREITLRELRAEIGNTSVPDPKARKAAETAALRNIVGRTILANAARAQGLDKTPDFAVQKQRAIDGLLVQALQQKVVADVPQPTKEEAQSFINANPDIFLERKVFQVDQIRMPRPSDPQVLKSLEPLKTLEQIEEVLKADKIPYQRAAGSLDAVGADPRMIQAIVKLPPGEVFVVPGGDGLLVNQIKDTKIIPFTGEAALGYAQKLLARQRTQEAVQRSFNDIIAKSASKVQFNKDYAPPKPSTAPQPGAPPAAGSPAAAPAKPS